MGNALHFFYDFENSNIAECYVTDRFFVFVAETLEMSRVIHPPCCVKIEPCWNLYYQTVKLGTQSKLYEQSYSQIILAI